MGTVDDLIAGLDEASGSALARVRDLAMQAVPDVEQGTSYGMPALRWRGRPLLGFNVCAARPAVYPFSPAAVDAVRDRLAVVELSTGTVRFTAADPLPMTAVIALVTRAGTRSRAEAIPSTTWRWCRGRRHESQ